MNIKLSDIVKFILENRRDSAACINWDAKQIANEVVEAISKNAFVVDVDNINAKILGIIIASPEESNRTLHVKAIICLRGGLGSLKRFLQVFKNNYPNYTIQAYRNYGADLVRYEKTARLVKLLELKAL